jgi:diguanylate cyclase (GGDEF)-like protein
MVAGNGPTVAPRVEEVPAYAAALNRNLAPIQAYVGVPVRHAGGTLFGTLCAFDEEAQSDVLLGAQSQLQLKARLLATVLELELARQQLRRRAERAELIAAQDALTGLANRRGWDQILAAEESRCQRYGHPACVLVVDINNLKAINDTQGHAAGDEVLRRCARVLADTSRNSDLVARLGGDEFGVLAVETTAEGGRGTRCQLARALADAGLNAAIGLAPRASSLNQAWHEADKDMYLVKGSQRACRRP